MPLFDFKCQCGHIERDVVIGTFGDIEQIGPCPKCGGKMEKLISKFTFRMGKMSSDRSSTPGRATCMKA